MIKTVVLDTSYYIFKDSRDNSFVCYYDSTFELDITMCISEVCKLIGIEYTDPSINYDELIIDKITNNIDLSTRFFMFMKRPILSEVSGITEDMYKQLFKTIIDTELKFNPLYKSFGYPHKK